MEVVIDFEKMDSAEAFVSELSTTEGITDLETENNQGISGGFLAVAFDVIVGSATGVIANRIHEAMRNVQGNKPYQIRIGGISAQCETLEELKAVLKLAEKS